MRPPADAHRPLRLPVEGSVETVCEHRIGRLRNHNDIGQRADPFKCDDGTVGYQRLARVCRIEKQANHSAKPSAKSDASVNSGPKRRCRPHRSTTDQTSLPLIDPPCQIT